MAFKKKEEPKVTIGKADIQVGSLIPPVPSLPVTSVNPKPRNEASPVAPAQKAPSQAVELRTNGRDDRAGDDKMLSVVKPYNRDASISIDAIHKSSLESPTLAQATMGCNMTEIIERTETFVREQIKLNKQLKGE